MNADTARAEVFGDSLACEEHRPAAFVAGALGSAAAGAACMRAEGLLRALAVIEDSRVEDSEDRGTTDLALNRIEAKLDLLTSLVATLCKSYERQDPLRALQWSALGVCIAADETVAPGIRGVFRIQPSDWLPESLVLPATVLAAVTLGDGPQLWLRFDPMSPTLTAALERHLFRVHRRAIADSRRPR